MINLAQEQIGLDKKIDIKIIGKKDGERIHEKLLTEEESVLSLETKDLYIIMPDITLAPFLPSYTPPKYPGAKKAKVGEYNTQSQKKISISQIKEILEEVDPFKQKKY
jgi:FlaA1/EpsC-like NDP-sugar epimerase